jgi:hypothetical protein
MFTMPVIHYHLPSDRVGGKPIKPNWKQNCTRYMTKNRRTSSNGEESTCFGHRNVRITRCQNMKTQASTDGSRDV